MTYMMDMSLHQNIISCEGGSSSNQPHGKNWMILLFCDVIVLERDGSRWFCIFLSSSSAGRRQMMICNLQVDIVNK